MTEKAVVYKTSGVKVVVEFEVGDSYNLLSSTVGGLIECVGLPGKNLDMWINEEGKYVSEYQNPRATAIFDEAFGGVDDIIMGDVIFARCNNEGETIGLTDEQVEYLLGYTGNVAQLLVPTHPEFYDNNQA
jgi:hypothetical protein